MSGADLPRPPDPLAARPVRPRKRAGVAGSPRSVYLSGPVWAWLCAQPPSASATIARLVEQAQREGQP